MRVCVVAPMQMELRPFVRAARLGRDGDVYRGDVGGAEVVAARVGVGTARSARATAELLDRRPCDHLIVTGVAGGLGPDLGPGDLLLPKVVEDAATGAEYVPAACGGRRRGRLVTTDDLMLDEEAARMARAGVAAVDMETAAIARVCEERGVTWTVFRAMSDHARDGLVDPEVVELLGPDGRADLRAAMRHVLSGPGRTARVRRLVRLGRDSRRAAAVAAAAAVRACGAWDA